MIGTKRSRLLIFALRNKEKAGDTTEQQMDVAMRSGAGARGNEIPYDWAAFRPDDVSLSAQEVSLPVIDPLRFWRRLN